LSPVDLVESIFSRIDEVEDRVRAFVSVQRSEALEAARNLEVEIKSNRYRGRLHGIPIAVKDVIDTVGVVTACGSKLMANRVPESDAAVVSLLKDAGAIIIGKTVTHELTFMVRQGMSPADAVLSATRSAAEALGVQDKLGTVEEGKSRT
jgi:aspartyl-tRNA(Asn)/glutamyl-tRNA(Gln) amidotransferase subunit A